HVNGKCLAGNGVNELAAGRKDAANRPEDEVDDRIDPGEGDDHANRDANCRANQAFSEYVELFEDRELEAWRAIGIVASKPAYRQRQSMTPPSILADLLNGPRSRRTPGCRPA